MTLPHNPITAVTHPDPYPYYAQLVAHKPLYYDETLGLWVAASAKIIMAILQDPRCRVRPLSEPVPAALLGSPAADIFRQLVRMNDGASHCPFKQAISATLTSVNIAQAREQSAHWARILADQCSLADFGFHLPVYVVGSLLGVPAELLQPVASSIDDFVRCLAPASSSAEQITRGKTAAGQLWTTFHALLEAQQASDSSVLLHTLARAATHMGRADADLVVANGIGFLSQAYEATAGLIGNTLVALAAHAEIRRDVGTDPTLLRHVIAEVLRYDAPIQNTRRFLAEDMRVEEQDLRAGDVVLLVLAAANRDPLFHAHPARFDACRNDPRSFTFGLGAHACPGDMLAALIAEAGVKQLLARNVASTPLQVTYRQSANARVPLVAEH